jgi:3',5'-cyclic AMP phosphodiesterase CpdA
MGSASNTADPRNRRLVLDGEPAAYARLRALLRPLRPPVFVIPGNHDDRAALGDAFKDAGYLPQTAWTRSG